MPWCPGPARRIPRSPGRSRWAPPRRAGASATPWFTWPRRTRRPSWPSMTRSTSPRAPASTRPRRPASCPWCGPGRGRNCWAGCSARMRPGRACRGSRCPWARCPSRQRGSWSTGRTARISPPPWAYRGRRPAGCVTSAISACRRWASRSSSTGCPRPLSRCASSSARPAAASGPGGRRRPAIPSAARPLHFALVVTQRRLAADSALDARGDVAAQWLPIAQCFAGRGQTTDPDRAGLPMPG